LLVGFGGCWVFSFLVGLAGFVFGFLVGLALLLVFWLGCHSSLCLSFLRKQESNLSFLLALLF
jgi:hypothetical protein